MHTWFFLPCGWYYSWKWKRGKRRGDGARCVIRYQEIRHYYFYNDGKSVDGDGRSAFRSHTSPYPSHHSGVLVISLGFYSYGTERSGHRYHTSQFSSYKHCGLYIAHPRLYNKIFQGVWKEKIHIKTILIIIIQAYHNIIITTFHLILIQECNHTKFVCFNIALLLLCMHIM